MASKAFIEELFKQHAADFRDVTGELDTFLCPICQSKFSSNNIHAETLSDGHIWQKYIRDKSTSGQVIHSHRVLLCKKCNSEAGTQGDFQAQLREELKDNEAQGIIFGERRIQVVTKLGDKPISLRATTKFQERNESGQIPVQLSVNIKRNNPKEIERLSAIDPDERFSVVVDFPHNHSHDLARSGWITSAYLFAFYTFGYWYILHDSLDVVRKYILASLDRNWQGDLPYPMEQVGITELP